MTKLKNPFKYPLRSRAAMVDFLVDNGGNFCYQNRQRYPLAWNVKLYNTNLEFDNLYKHYTQNIGELNPTQIAAARAYYEKKYGKSRHETNKEQDAARSEMWDSALEVLQSTVFDGDVYNRTWDGTEYDVKWGFTGRSAGYATLFAYEGYDMARVCANGDYFREWLEEKGYNPDGSDAGYERDFKFIRKMYKFVVEMNEYLTHKNAEDDFEWTAAYQFFDNEVGELMEANSDDKVLLHPV